MSKDCTTILGHIKSGDVQKAIALLYSDDYWHRIARHRFKNFERRLNPPHEWQDIFHEAVIRFVQQASKGADVQHCGNYFGTICHNICFKEIEKMDGRKSPKKDGEEDPNTEGGGEPIKPKSPIVNTPVDGLENLPDTESQDPMVRMLDLAKQYLMQLEERDRDLLNLKYFRRPLLDVDKEERKNIIKNEAESLAKKWGIGVDSIPPLTTLAKNKWIELMKRHRKDFEDLDQFSLF